MMIPATMNAARNSRIALPMLATMASADLASSPTFGGRRFTSAGRSSWAVCQAA
jgi:hypothetical protein